MCNNEASIFNIQKFSLNDGPGIRTVVFFKGCPLACKWCSNPESQSMKIQILWDKRLCVSCKSCIYNCPNKAISESKGRIIINHNLCNACNICINQCPKKALKTIGKKENIENIIEIIKQDIPFYEESGGGVTLSGGEILLQHEFVIKLLKRLKEEKIHTCIETTGYANHEVFKNVIAHVDYILFDIKHHDPIKHQEGTGLDNKLILDNFYYAIKINKPILARIPVIKEYNDSLDDAKAFAELLKKYNINKCQLLPFHQFGENKYEQLSKEYKYNNYSAYHKEDLQKYLETFIQNGIDAFF